MLTLDRYFVMLTGYYVIYSSHLTVIFLFYKHKGTLMRARPSMETFHCFLSQLKYVWDLRFLRSYMKKITVSRDVMPCNLMERYLHFGGTYYLHLDPSALKQEATGPVETLVPAHPTTRHHTTQNRKLPSA